MFAPARRVPLTGFALQGHPVLRFPAPLAAPMLAAGLASAAGHVSHAATLTLAVNHSVRLPVAGRAASVVLGNAAVADVTVIDSHTLFLTGKAPGSTDLAVVDPLGRTVYAADIAVSAGSGRTVTIHRAAETAELSCDPRCLAPVRDGAAPSASAAPITAAATSLSGMAPVSAGAYAGGVIGSAVGGALGGGAAPTPSQAH